MATLNAWNLVFVWANTLEKICEVRWPKDRPVPSVGTTVDIEFWSGLARSGDMAVRVVEYRPLVRHDTDNHDRSEVHARVFVEVPRPPDVPYPRRHRGGK